MITQEQFKIVLAKHQNLQSGAAKRVEPVLDKEIQNNVVLLNKGEKVHVQINCANETLEFIKAAYLKNSFRIGTYSSPCNDCGLTIELTK